MVVFGRKNKGSPLEISMTHKLENIPLNWPKSRENMKKLRDNYGIAESKMMYRLF